MKNGNTLTVFLIGLLASVIFYLFFLQKPSLLHIIIAPQRLVIDKLGIDTPVEKIGKDANGNMDVPKDISDVGWYDLGPRPGDVGNAVIDGHLDSKTGPAIFYKLSDLQIGDTVKVISNDGRILTFIVTKKVRYNDADFPIVNVFGPSDGKHLNLITCTGIFDRANENYLQRLVVYTTLKDR